MAFTHSESLTRLTETVPNGEPVIGAGAGTGMSAKFAERVSVSTRLIRVVGIGRAIAAAYRTLIYAAVIEPTYEC